MLLKEVKREWVTISVGVTLESRFLLNDSDQSVFDGGFECVDGSKNVLSIDIIEGPSRLDMAVSDREGDDDRGSALTVTSVVPFFKLEMSARAFEWMVYGLWNLFKKGRQWTGKHHIPEHFQAILQ